MQDQVWISLTSVHCLGDCWHTHTHTLVYTHIHTYTHTHTHYYTWRSRETRQEARKTRDPSHENDYLVIKRVSLMLVRLVLFPQICVCYLPHSFEHIQSTSQTILSGPRCGLDLSRQGVSHLCAQVGAQTLLYWKVCFLNVPFYK